MMDHAMRLLAIPVRRRPRMASGKCMMAPRHEPSDPMTNGSLFDGGDKVQGDMCLFHIQPQRS